MSGEYVSTGRIRAANRELSDEDLSQIARQALAVAGLDETITDPRALAGALGYRTIWAPRLPNGAESIVVGKTIYYADDPDDATMERRVALPLAHLILEAWGYDLGAAARLSDRLTG
jgi:hypothetical protein